MTDYQNIYEINTRVWLKRFQPGNKLLSISQVPDEYWLKLKNIGMDYVWLMGVWETVPASIDRYCLTNGLKNEYTKALPDWNRHDIIGSPYAINNYKLNPLLGVQEELSSLKQKLNQVGLKLVLDFIPNHFHADTELLSTNPEIFLQVNNELCSKDNVTYYKSENGNGCFAHGKDPNFAAWQDTVQINYFSKDARHFMTGKLIELAEVCDGLRCDMAMLVLNKVFEGTWKEMIEVNILKRPQSEFWRDAINEVKQKREDFIFIAEAYWDMEWELQQQGFDFTYDKSLYDRLIHKNALNINEHLKADSEYQSKSVRFTENHDEPRAVTAFGTDKSKAASLISFGLPGMHLYHDGQFEGKSIKMPAQLGREPDEPVNPELSEFYNRLLDSAKLIRDAGSNWELLECKPAGEQDSTNQNFVAYSRSGKNVIYIIAVNYSELPSYCRHVFNINSDLEELELKDLLSNKSYKHSRKKISDEGLFIKLERYKGHVFEIKL